MVDAEKRSYFVVGIKPAEKSTARVLYICTRDNAHVEAMMIMMIFSNEYDLLSLKSSPWSQKNVTSG